MQKVSRISLFTVLLVFALYSCKDNNNTGSNEHNPNEPVVLASFAPDSGGMATKVIMKGKNFGSDPTKIKVYYNDKRATVIGSNGEQMYIITPKQPGDTCDIAVVIGSDSSVYDHTFSYKTSVTVTTIAGQKGTAAFKGGSLAEATFSNPSTLCVDSEGNIFLSHWGTGANFAIISQKNDYVAELAATGSTGAPTADANGKVVMTPTDGGYNFWSFDPDVQWAGKRMTILRPTTEDISAGLVDFTINYKHSFASHKDGMIYTRSYAGDLVKFDPLTRKGTKVDHIMPDSDAFLLFHPIQTNILYIIYQGKSCIYTYDLDTKEHTLFAGSVNTADWRDGERLSAYFNHPRQFVFDEEGSMIIADSDNHCIRKIDMDGMTTTIIGMGGKKGYQDGNPDDALFDQPRGVCIDADYNIYIADYNNNCVRKLAIE